MGKLNSRNGTLRFDELRRTRERLNVRIFPNSQIYRTDASIGCDRGSFGKNQRRAANCARTEMDKMPVRRESIDARILAHRRNDNAIAKCDFANRERRE
jgi:hypothetical protein